MAKTPCSQCRKPGFNPWSGNKIPHATTKTCLSQIKSINQTKFKKEKDTIESDTVMDDKDRGELLYVYFVPIFSIKENFSY